MLQFLKDATHAFGRDAQDAVLLQRIHSRKPKSTNGELGFLKHPVETDSVVIHVEIASIEKQTETAEQRPHGEFVQTRRTSADVVVLAAGRRS